MNPALSEALKEAYAVAPATKVLLHTLEIRQFAVQPAIYLAQSRKGFTATLENGSQVNFEAGGFQFSLPQSDDQGFQSLNISIDNVGRRINEFIKHAKSQQIPVEIVYRPYLSDDLSAPAMSPPLLLYLKDIQVTITQVNARATFMDIINKKFPLEIYGRERFPTLG